MPLRHLYRGLGVLVMGVTLLVACAFPDYRTNDSGSLSSGGSAAGGGSSAGAGPVAAGSGCSSAMLVCLNMDQAPSELGWMPTVEGATSWSIITDTHYDNRSLRLETRGAEGEPAPIATLTRTLDVKGDHGRFAFDFRLLDVGPYTQLTIAEVDLGQRVLRFYLKNIPEGSWLLLQLTEADRRQLLWEETVPDADFFNQVRSIELRYDLSISGRFASLAAEGLVLMDNLPLGDTWTPAQPTIRLGTFGFALPSSGITFELDNVVFDDRSP